jgi:hypothetical protein
MLAPLLLASLITSVLIMLAGWVHDRIAGASDVGASCPLYPAASRRSRGARGAWGIEPPDRVDLADNFKVPDALVARLPKHRVFIAAKDGPGA